MGLVLYDASDSIPGPDKCGGDSHTHDDYCSGTLDYPYPSPTTHSHSSQSRRHASRRQPPHIHPESIDTPAPARRGRRRGFGSGSGPAPPFTPPSLMRQDAFYAGGSLASQEKELHRLGVYDRQPATHATRSTPQDRQDRPSYNTPHEPIMTTTAMYELEDGSTQGSADSSFPLHAQQANHARYLDGYSTRYRDKNNANWTMHQQSRDAL